VRRSPATDTACLERLERILASVRADAPATIAALNEARDSGHPQQGDGQPGGKGGHTDLSDRLRYDAQGNLADSQDPADLALVEFGRCLDQAKSGIVGMRRIMERNRRGEDLTPTGLCRDGACPAGAQATTVLAGVPRCSACKAFWYSVSNPDEREERGWVGQPKPLPRTEQAVA
jgi:hypothetical protein